MPTKRLWVTYYKSKAAQKRNERFRRSFASVEARDKWVASYRKRGYIITVE